MKTKQNKTKTMKRMAITRLDLQMEWSLSTFKYDRIFYSTFKKSINSA